MKRDTPQSKASVPIHTFRSQANWQRWLDRQHRKSPGIWIRFFKKGSGIPSVTYANALEDALCYGWIDGQLDKYDEKSWIRRFSPRRTGSVWSKRNVAIVRKLARAGRMKPAGLAQVADAKRAGTWKAAYDSPGQATAPPDFLKRLLRNKKARAYFNGLNKANRYAIFWRLQTAKKPETRERRMKLILEMMASGRKFH